MLFHRVLVSSCFVVAALTANPGLAQPAKPKDGPLGMKFVPLPKATFYMGWNGPKGSARKTEIKEDFEIAIHTVTQGQWREVMGNNPSWFSRAGKGKDRVKDINDEDLKHFPVEMVSWKDAQKFITKLNEKEKGKGYQYRLPSEAEWEYACRGGATSEEECSHHFYFAKPTNDLSSKQANFHGDFPFGKADKGPFLARTTKVGSYAPNKVGLYDMHGNVWQWCEDLWETGSSLRVTRGSSWVDKSSFCRAATRNGDEPAAPLFNTIGFRLARGFDHVKQDAERFQGAWKIVQYVERGQSTAKDELEPMAVLFNGDKFEIKHPGGAGKKGTFKLDPSKKPAAIDLFGGGEKKPMVGIYVFDGKTLKICTPSGPDIAKGIRPTEFVSTAENRNVLMVLEPKKVP